MIQKNPKVFTTQKQQYMKKNDTLWKKSFYIHYKLSLTLEKLVNVTLK